MSAINEGKCAFTLGSSPDANPYRKATADGYSKYQMTGIEHGSDDMNYSWAQLKDLECQWDSGYATAKRKRGNSMTTKYNGWTPKDMTNVAPCNVNTYRCKGDHCILHGDCQQNDRHECQECYDVLST